MAAGDFSGSVRLSTRDEIGQLADAFDTMRAALADRERRLAEANRNIKELFDHMRQGILSFGPDGCVGPDVSRQATVLFERTNFEGIQIQQLLYGSHPTHDVDALAFAEWRSMAFDMSRDDWSELVRLAPAELTLRRGDGREVPLELEFRAVGAAEANRVERIMVLATDVSDRKRLENTLVAQEELHAQRLRAMQRLIAGGGQVFVTFVDATRARLARCRSVADRGSERIPMAEIDELFRHVHTAKGEEQGLELTELEAQSAALETSLDALRTQARRSGGDPADASIFDLPAAFAGLEAALDRAVDVFAEASPLGRAALEQITVSKVDLEAVATLARSGPEDLARAIDRLAARRFGESTSILIDVTPTWGDLACKRVRLEVVGQEVRVRRALAQILQGVLTHLVRNAIAHGIEPPSARTAAGKDPIGTVRAAAFDEDGDVVIVVEDDGRGLDRGRIHERAAALGLDETGEVAELVFASGLTTSPGQGPLAGLGVGLGSVRADLQGVGYDIAITTEPGRFTRFVMRSTVRSCS